MYIILTDGSVDSSLDFLIKDVYDIDNVISLYLKQRSLKMKPESLVIDFGELTIKFEAIEEWFIFEGQKIDYDRYIWHLKKLRNPQTSKEFYE